MFEDASDVQIGDPNRGNAIDFRAPSLRKLSDFTETRVHTIHDFLKRERPIADVTWTISDAVNSDLLNLQLPNAILSSEMITRKVSDFAFFRADAVFRFSINVSRFATGSLLAWYAPVPTLTGVPDASTLTQQTCYPHCIIDAGSAATIEFRVPFTYFNQSWDIMQDSVTPWSEVFLTVLNPLVAATGSSYASVRVWLRCENISLDVPVPNQIPPYTPSVWKAHMSSEAIDDSKKGVISSSLRKVSSLASDVAGLGLGPISEVGEAASWVTGIAANVAETFGYSKPRNVSINEPMIQQPGRFMASYNGNDNSMPFAFDARNSLSIENSLFGSDVDQMDIKYICSNPSFIETFNWSTNDNVGAVLATWPVCPGFSGIGSATTNISPTLAGFVASMFSFWRGGMGYKLQVVANAFYSGRLGMFFLPRTTTVPNPVSFEDIDAATQMICDVRGSTTCNYQCPFANARPWLRVRCASRTSTGTGMTYSAINQVLTSSGLCGVYVVNQLVCPDTVNNTISINLFSYALPDIEFAIPNCPLYVPLAVTPSHEVEKKAHPNRAHNWSTPSKSSSSCSKIKNSKGEDFESAVWTAHMDQAPQKLNLDPGSKDLGHAFLKTDASDRNTDIPAATMGELCTSLRQLIRCFSQVGNTTVANGQCLLLDPAYFGNDVQSPSNCRLWRISRIFAYYRGSIRWKFLALPGVGTSGVMVSNKVIYMYSDMTTALTPSTPLGSIAVPTVNEISFPQFVNVAQTPIAEMQNAYYSRNFLQVLTLTACIDRQQIVMYPVSVDSENQTGILFTAAGDDFSFGFLKAPPLLTTY